MEPEASVEVSAPSVDEAIILGLTRLTATRDEVDIEVLDEGSRGFLGIGMRPARVRLTRRPPEPEPAPTPEPTPPTPQEPEPEPAPTQPQPDPQPEPEPTPEPEPEPQPQLSPEPPAPASVEPQPAQPKKSRESQLPEEELDREAVEQAALDVANHLFEEIDVEVTTSWHQEDRPTLWLSLQGTDADALVGPRAQTLHSIQYLFRALVHRMVDGNYNLVVDSDGYRRRRRRSLESLASQKADQAAESGDTIRLRSMPAHERRVIHMVLRKDDRVETKSVGHGRNRAVTIVPTRDRSDD